MRVLELHFNEFNYRGHQNGKSKRVVTFNMVVLKTHPIIARDWESANYYVLLTLTGLLVSKAQADHYFGGKLEVVNFFVYMLKFEACVSQMFTIKNVGQDIVGQWHDLEKNLITFPIIGVVY